MAATKHLIGGSWVDGAGPGFPDVNPATGKPVADVAIGTPDEVDRAVRAARAALERGWADAPSSARRKLLLELARLVAADAAEIGRTETRDNGMPVSIAIGEALIAAEALEYFAGWTDKFGGEVIAVPAPNVLDYTLKEPVGVVAAIVPWNAPMWLSACKLAPALAAGNTVVLKPSEHAPMAPLRLGELVRRAGFPDGVVNIVTGTGPETGQALLEHPGVDKISFTGGTETGRHVAATAGRLLKRVSLELGGKSANVVFADADLDAAAMQACVACFVVSGQQCIAGSRLLVEDRIHDVLLDKVLGVARGFLTGDPMQPSTQLGPLISDRQLARVLAYVDEARRDADVVLGGERLTGDLADGYFLPPTVVTRVRNDSRLAREEIFGPVLSVIPFDGVDEAIEIANDTPYGLAGGVWTNDLHRAHLVAKAIHAGTIWVNSWLAINPQTPFGGYKASGFGREGGREALEDYSQTKNVYVQLRRST
jgi:acyl-CoA reductase-like NAD-dependent aldehyde dehydrogenase